MRGISSRTYNGFSMAKQIQFISCWLREVSSNTRIKVQIQVESEEIRKQAVEEGVAAGQKLGSQI